VLDMGAYDLVLCMDWFKRFSPITYAWLDQWIEFKYKNQLVRL
jgi:hypothetical protein